MDTLYAISTKDCGDFIGTFEEIKAFAIDMDINLQKCDVYQISHKVQVKVTLEDV